MWCRNRLVMCIFNICKDVLGRLPKVVGIDVVEMALWAKVRKFHLLCCKSCTLLGLSLNTFYDVCLWFYIISFRFSAIIVSSLSPFIIINVVNTIMYDLLCKILSRRHPRYVLIIKVDKNISR